MRELKVLLGAAAAMFALALPAAAQYPGTTSTTVAATSQTVGTLAVGQTTTVTSCGFPAGSVSLAVNGVGGATDSVESDGCARTTLAVLGNNLVRVEGVQLNANCGSNTLAATGGTRTVNTTFGIDCPAAADAGLLPRTGATILRWSLAGGALLAVGSLLVLSNRRRETIQAS